MHGLSAGSKRSLAAWAAVAIAGLAVALTWSARAGAETTGAEAIGDVALGSQLYALDCAQCHAANGLGAEVGDTGRLAPPLRNSEQVTAAYVDLVLRTGRMPPARSPFDNRARQEIYTDEERRAIVAYTVAEFDLENDLLTVGEGDPARGQQLWAANCAACHGSTGAGGVAGGGTWTPRVNTLEPVTIAEAARVGPFQMPAFDDEQISREGLADIAAFMAAIEEETGTPLGLVELNPVFASGFVALFAVVMLLSLLWISGKPSWFPDPQSTDPDSTDPDTTDAGDTTDTTDTTRTRDE
jgi:ubiquinol-cytochrome c reductase cytochrome c subunit